MSDKSYCSNFPYRAQCITDMSGEEETETPTGPVENAWAIKVPEFQKGEMKSHLLEESSFSVIFPKYREKYLQECWKLLQKSLDVSHLPYILKSFTCFHSEFYDISIF